MGTIDSCFAGLLPRLAETWQVVAVELQGHGHTADLDRPLSYQQIAEDTAALMGLLGIAAADLVGDSMGGAVALQVASDRPGLARRLVYAGGTCYAPGGLYPELLAHFQSPQLDALAGSKWHQAYLAAAPDPAAWPTLVTKVNELDRTFGGWPAENIHTVDVPALLIIGDADIVRPEHTVEMFRLLGGGAIGDLAEMPRSQLAILPGTSHVGVLERVDWLHSMIPAFLRAKQIDPGDAPREAPSRSDAAAAATEREAPRPASKPPLRAASGSAEGEPREAPDGGRPRCRFECLVKTDTVSGLETADDHLPAARLVVSGHHGWPWRCVRSIAGRTPLLGMRRRPVRGHTAAGPSRPVGAACLEGRRRTWSSASASEAVKRTLRRCRPGGASQRHDVALMSSSFG
jgi:pimeloyl-ACP methyl ester carboxylesterase